MKILVIDGQGGGIGRQLVIQLKKNVPEAEITAIGTNSLASQAMIKAGADHAATGENAVIVNYNAAALLPSVLQCVQRVVCHSGEIVCLPGVCAEYAALLM